MSTEEGRELGWNDTIENDSGDFELIPNGEYPFVITGVERGRHTGSAKLPACNKATLHVRVEMPDGSTQTTNENLFMHSKTEGLLCQFFRSIGHRKSGEKLVMDWAKVTGAKGRCKISIRKYNKTDGSKGEANSVAFLDPGDAKQKESGFTPGEF